MPHLQFEVNRSVADAAKLVFAEEVRQLFAKVMGSGTDHISISIRECITHDLSIGRVTEPEKGIAIVDADIRRGRTLEQRREEWGHREGKNGVRSLIVTSREGAYPQRHGQTPSD
jgi:phenylpyruvate tautomerase PptA (4-oxalocrotonate tautomerase family)